MITFTKEQLIASAHARIEFAEMMLAGELEPLKERTWSIELELARIALASLEAEPVSVFKIDHESSLIKHVKRVVSETNAQPAPVSVPAAMEIDDDFDSSFEHGKAVGWNACRAAMLQSFGNSEQLNSPVIPDGWVMVPVEPTAEMLQSGISAQYERSQIQIHDRPAPGPMECAYVAMIAAAPQQEVK